MAQFTRIGGLSYPTDLLYERRWYALMTRSRMEKRSVLHLLAVGVEADAAVVEVNRSWSDRIKRVGTPLFPGYVFARFTLRELARSLAAPGIVGVVRSDGVPIPIRDGEISEVQRLARGITSTGVVPIRANFDDLGLGSPVVVTSGPFEGLRGVFLEVRGQGHVAVRISAIREARSVQLERWAVAPVSEEAQEVAGAEEAKDTPNPHSDLL